MLSPGLGLLRGVRAGLLATVVVGLSLVSHRLAGGAAPGAVPVLVLVVLTAVAIRGLLRSRLAFGRLLCLLGLGQLLLHYAFEQCALLVTAPAHAHAADNPGPMLAAHVVATVAVSVILTHADRALWALWSWLTMRSVPSTVLDVVDRRRGALVLTPVAPAPPAPGHGAVMGRAPPLVHAAAH
ncbi:hypothetical protein [Oerskovia turbata]